MADAISVNLLEYSLEIGVVTDLYYGVCREKGKHLADHSSVKVMRCANQR
jgi:hypothetical protein